ncbi:hypothetical protein ASE67_10375 [Sphingomonas sp. Leaf23]|uniref:L,D-transpeptidase family protein n=1 Tax=Sphingomonas sp. Leaf23 TaxID=1735689 RepID=UPI00070192CF|nr:L,D-transpeptidase family protein [Sphingomonas sp. Leaf23]KQM86241.1 hypothetical protein ASE67_10375 [Sphingomonas sp. Leaf23]
MGVSLRAGLGVAVLAGVVGATAGGAAMLLSAERPAPVAAKPMVKVAAAKPAPVPLPVPVAIPAAVSTPAPEAMVVRRVLNIEGPFTHGRWVWDEEGAPASGKLIVTIDLDAQVLSVFRDGYEIGAAVVLYGADWKPTPLGAMKITEKDADHVSNLYGAPMPYMLRLTNDGISIHGSDVQEGGATHGCIGVPTAFAKKLFGAAKLGDRVIITNGKRLNMGGAITA